MKRIIGLIGIIVLIIIWCFFPREEEAQEIFQAMDTIVVINAKGVGAKEAVSAAVAHARALDERLSAYAEGSDVWKINNGSESWGSDDTVGVIKRSIYFSELSGGVFDVTIMPLVKLWKETENPTDEEIAAAKNLVDYRRLQENSALPPGMAIDLGGIAKGFMADEIAVILRENGIDSAIINAGGNILVMGDKPCIVGIQAPYAQEDQNMGTVTVRNKTVVTSGFYSRGAHIIDPRTGNPVGEDILSATVICDVSMDADALSTILFILGEAGFQILEGYGAEGILIDKYNRVKTTAGVDLTITDSNYIMNN